MPWRLPGEFVVSCNCATRSPKIIGSATTTSASLRCRAIVSNALSNSVGRRTSTTRICTRICRAADSVAGTKAPSQITGVPSRYLLRLVDTWATSPQGLPFSVSLDDNLGRPVAGSLAARADAVRDEELRELLAVDTNRSQQRT